MDQLCDAQPWPLTFLCALLYLKRDLCSIEEFTLQNCFDTRQGQRYADGRGLRGISVSVELLVT